MGKAEIYDVIFKGTVAAPTFDAALKDLSKSLDNDNSSEKRILDINKHKAETSIWFDSFDDTGIFSENIFDGCICFLLAKDLSTQLIEDKEQKAIKTFDINAKQKPKAPAHCVYLTNDSKLLIETNTNAPSDSTFLRGIKKKLGIHNDDIELRPLYYKDILGRLQALIESIKSIELIDLNIRRYIKKDSDDDGKIYHFITHPNSTIDLKLSVENDKLLQKSALDIFTDAIQSKDKNLLRNIKIEYLDEKQHSDSATLFKNLVFLKIDFTSLEDISELQNMERLEYSKNVYREMIKAYSEQKDIL